MIWASGHRSNCTTTGEPGTWRWGHFGLQNGLIPDHTKNKRRCESCCPAWYAFIAFRSLFGIRILNWQILWQEIVVYAVDW